MSIALKNKNVLFIHSPFGSGGTFIQSAINFSKYKVASHGYQAEFDEKFQKQIENYNLKAATAKNFIEFNKRFKKSIQVFLFDLVEETGNFTLFDNAPMGKLSIHPYIKKALFPRAKFIWIERNDEDWLNTVKKWQLIYRDVYPDAEKNWQEDSETENNKLIKKKRDAFVEFENLRTTFPKDTLIFDIDTPKWESLSQFLNLNKIEDDHSIQKDDVVVIHSPFKTGTTSLGDALVKMGYAYHDFGYHRDLELKYKDSIEVANNLAIKYKSFESFKNNHQQDVTGLLRPLFNYTEGHKIFGDIPFGHLMIDPFVKKLAMPRAKFIWIERDEKIWFNSAKNWHYKHPELYTLEIKEWEQNSELAIQNLIKMRDEGFERFAYLQQAFPDDCLIVSLENLTWEPLAKFFNLPIPNEEFPILNKGNV